METATSGNKSAVAISRRTKQCAERAGSAAAPTDTVWSERRILPATLRSSGTLR